MAKGKDKGINLEAAERSRPTGANYLLAIAINDYEHHPKLSNCVRDAAQLVSILQEKYGFLPDHTVSLFDQEATAANLYTHLVELSQKVQPQDNVVVYFSGHGFYDRSDRTGHLVPVEAPAGAVWHYFSNANLVNRIRAIKSFHTFLIVDSCFSGSLFASKDVGAMALAEVVEGLPSRWALAAGQIETVEDGLHGDHSPFAKALLSYLEANNSPLVPASELIQHVKRVTPHNARQTPVGGVLFKTGDVGGEFVFHLRRTEGQLWMEAKAAGTLTAYQQFLKAYPDGQYAGEAHRLASEAEEVEAWDKAVRRNTIAGYDAYLSKHPEGKYVREALEALDKLEESKAWRNTIQRNSVGAYRKYLVDYPRSVHREEAEARIRELLGQEKEGETWQVVQQENTIAAFNAYLKEFPDGAHAEAARNRVRQLEQAAQEQQAREEARRQEENAKRASSYQASRPTTNSPVDSQLPPPSTPAEALRRQKGGVGRGFPNWLKYALPAGLIVAVIVIWQISKPRGVKETDTPGTTEIMQPASSAIEKPAMEFVEGGKFEMGDTFGDGQDDEKPPHQVIVSDFYIGKYEVTFDEFDTFCRATGREKPDDEGWGRGRRPVINVSWFDAVEYCNWLSEQHGYQKVYNISGSTVTVNWRVNGYRLPTEAEWEFAARSRGKKEKWAGTSTESSLASYANYSGKDGYEYTAPVGSFRVNSAGLHDMSGNVWEWCWDWYDSGYYEKSKNSRDPRGPDSGSGRVYRGGSGDDNPAYVRCADRSADTPDLRYNYLGFRLARAVR